jgi:hypothetical protein
MALSNSLNFQDDESLSDFLSKACLHLKPSNNFSNHNNFEDNNYDDDSEDDDDEI